MKLLFPGAVIRRERLKRNWSQEGLCRGICAVSYLSKIEQGKTEASPEILRMLFALLNLPWYDDAQTRAKAGALTKRCYEALFSCDEKALSLLRDSFSDQEELLSNSPHALDAALLHGLLANPQKPAPGELEPFFDPHRLALQRMMQGRYEEAMQLYPCVYISLRTGIALYERGESDAAALEYLHHTYDMAAREGYVHAMMLARVYMGNCYCNRIDIENMNLQYRIARRLAKSLNDQEILRTIGYNSASAHLEAGYYEKAYDYFVRVEEPTAMELHKLAICCEKLGLPEEALSALNRAEELLAEASQLQYPHPGLVHQMCRLVRMRLEHKDYLGFPQYGEELLYIFSQCRETLPIGYAAFHLPWVLEWYTASRQYRRAYELIRDFPIKLPLKQI